MRWEPVDIIVAAIIVIIMIIVFGAFILRGLEVEPSPEHIVIVWDTFLISAVAIISLYVGSRLNNKDE